MESYAASEQMSAISVYFFGGEVYSLTCSDVVEARGSNSTDVS